MCYFKQLCIPVNPDKEIPLYSKSGVLVASGYKRVVVGGRGPYQEFDADQIKCPLIVPENARWRLLKSWESKIFYIEYRTKPDEIMVYHQKKLVKYADYLIDHLYISPYDLRLADGKLVINGDAPKWKLD